MCTSKNTEITNSLIKIEITREAIKKSISRANPDIDTNLTLRDIPSIRPNISESVLPYRPKTLIDTGENGLEWFRLAVYKVNV